MEYKQQQQQQQHSLSVPSKLGQARVKTHQEPQVTVQALPQLLSKYSYSNIHLQIYPKLSNIFLLPPLIPISVFLYLSSYYQLSQNSTMHQCLWRSPLDMAKPPQPMLDKLFFNWYYPQAITYIIVPNFVHYCVTTNSS